MRYHLAFGKDLRVYALERSRLLYDSAFVAPFEGELPAQTVYYVILQGTVAWRSPDERFEGPAVLRLSPSTLDGERGENLRRGVPGPGQVEAERQQRLDCITLDLPRAACLP